jgi:cell wall-associated NlpC family hydrolase
MVVPRTWVTTAVIAVALAGAAGCASSGAVPQPFPRPGRRPDPPAAALPADIAAAPRSVADGYSIAGTALALRGIPYRNGGSDPGGFDCSGFIWYVFGQHGIRVSRTVGEQYREGLEVPPDAIRAGDLLFFNTQGGGASHVGMAIGGDEFVHAPSARGEVRVERMTAPYWSSRYIGARRIQ